MFSIDLYCHKRKIIFVAKQHKTHIAHSNNLQKAFDAASYMQKKT